MPGCPGGAWGLLQVGTGWSHLRWEGCGSHICPLAEMSRVEHLGRRLVLRSGRKLRPRVGSPWRVEVFVGVSVDV